MKGKTKNRAEAVRSAVFYVLSSRMYHEGGGKACGICKRSGIYTGTGAGFYPTPSTLSTCMYYTEIHPLTKEKVYVPKILMKSRSESFDAV